MKENNLRKILLSPWTITAVFVLGFLARFLYLDSYPGGIAQDEAFAGWFAYALGKDGFDNFGYGNPVYFTAWGSGMSVLYSYLSIPFVKILGLTAWAVRLPQAIFSFLSLTAFYFLVKIMVNKETAVISAFLLAINPWHIVMSRWGLDASLAPAFVLFGMLFFVKGLEKRPWLLLSAVFYGLSLYCYATIWLILPFLLLFQLVYAFRCGKLSFDRYLAAFVLILGLLAVPLFLFLLINMAGFPEITTRFLSIPKLLSYRGGEYTVENLGTHVLGFLKMFFTQKDWCIWNAVPGYGYYYLFSWPLIVLGFVRAGRETVRGWEKKEFCISALFFVCFLLLVLEALLMRDVEMNKVNMLHLCVIFFCAFGIAELGNYAGEKITTALLALYLVSFFLFAAVYTGNYQKEVAKEFQKGDIEAIRFADSLTEELVGVHETIYYPKVYFALEMPAKLAAETTTYRNYPDAFLLGKQIDHFKFFWDLDEKAFERYAVMILPNEEKEKQILLDAGYRIREFDYYIVAY